MSSSSSQRHQRRDNNRSISSSSNLEICYHRPPERGGTRADLGSRRKRAPKGNRKSASKWGKIRESQEDNDASLCCRLPPQRGSRDLVTHCGTHATVRSLSVELIHESESPFQSWPLTLQSGICSESKAALVIESLPDVWLFA